MIRALINAILSRPDCRNHPDRTVHRLSPIFTGGMRGTTAASDTRYGADRCDACGDVFIWVGEWHFRGRGSWARIPQAVTDRRPRSDMYGHEIVPLGETGYGVSTTFYAVPSEGPLLRPLWTVFHKSDGYRQALFSVQLGDQFSSAPNRANAPLVVSTFWDRIDELMALKPHGDAS